MDDDQQFCLRWNNHQSTLVAVFDTLLENGTLVDCTLAAEGKCLNAHKVVLSACSPYFESLLSKHFDKHPILILKDVKFQELKAMMDYMYRGEVNISQDQLGALLKAAESLQIKGLSDNRKGETERKPAPTLPPKSPQPASTIPKVQGLTIEQRSRDDSREGSMSPGPRKKKRLRRKSEELDNHDASNSSESHSLPAQNIPSSLPAVSKMNADVPEPVETKSEILTRHKQPDELPQVPIIKEKLETHTELMLEPKSEYVEEMNEDSIEDLTLDDDDLSNMEQVDDQAGPSHGNAGEGSSQGFGGWHMGNQSQDEVFLAAQEAVGAHRDSQGFALLYKDQVRRLMQFHGLEPFAEPEVIIQTGSRKLSNITAPKKASKPKKQPKSRKGSQTNQPRVSTYEHKTGKIFKIFRCLTCPSFVKKNQPHCFTCMGVPHLGQKKVAALKRAGLEEVIPKKEPALVKKTATVRKTVKPKKSLKRKRKPGSRIPCTLCHRRTKCRDGICMICKTKNEASTSQSTTTHGYTDTKNKASKKSIANIKSIVVKPARQSAKAISNGTPSNPYQRFGYRNTRSSRSRRSLEKESNEIFIPESNADIEPLPMNSETENPLEQPHKEDAVQDQEQENYFVTMSDIHSILADSQI